MDWSWRGCRAESTIDSPRPRRYHYRPEFCRGRRKRWIVTVFTMQRRGETKKGIGSRTVARRNPRNKSLTRRFRPAKMPTAPTNFEFRPHDPANVRGMSQRDPVLCPTSRRNGRAAQKDEPWQGAMRHLKLQSAYELPENVNSALHPEESHPFYSHVRSITESHIRLEISMTVSHKISISLSQVFYIFKSGSFLHIHVSL